MFLIVISNPDEVGMRYLLLTFKKDFSPPLAGQALRQQCWRRRNDMYSLYPTHPFVLPPLHISRQVWRDRLSKEGIYTLVGNIVFDIIGHN
jgi:hypothetical protein